MQVLKIAFLWILLATSAGATLGNCAGTYANAQNQEPPLVRYAGAMAARHNVDPALLKAICHVESDWRARDGKAGEKGLCQIKPDTVLVFCKRCYANQERLLAALKDPRANIELAAMYLAYLQRLVGTDPTFLAAAYNGGPNGPVQYLLKVRTTLALYTPRDSL